MKLPKILEMIQESIDQEIEYDSRPSKVSGIYRASSLGDCPRSICYTHLGYVPEKISGSLALLFADGHLHHHAVRGLLRRVGYISNEESQAAKSYGDFIITGTTDGIFNGNYPIDIKSINPFSFKSLTKDYIWENHRGYVYQIQTYLDIFDKDYGALLFKNKMNGELKIFWYKRDPKLMQKIIKLMSQIHLAIQQKKLIKRPYTKSSKQCKRCPFRMQCHGSPMERREWS